MDWIEVHVAAVVDETPIDRRFVLRVPTAAREAFGYRPGQHVLVQVESDEGVSLKSALSLCARPGGGEVIELAVRARGGFGEAFYALREGDPVLVSTPRGRFRMDAAPGLRLACFAHGNGVTPFRGLVDELAAAGRRDPVTLVVSEERPEHLVFADAFRAHERAHAFFRYVPTITGEAPSWTGRRGPIDAALVEAAIGAPAQAVVYACGATAFVDPVVGWAAAAGVPDERIHREKWG